MDATEVARRLLAGLGGRENITSNDACMTRLRVGVRSLSRVDFTQIKATDGVMGVVESSTIQIVLGPGTVNKVLDAFVGLTGIPRGASVRGASGVDAGGTDASVRGANEVGTSEPKSPDASAPSPTTSEQASQNKAAQTARHAGPVQAFLKRIANVFVPLLPGIIAAGLINGIANAVNAYTSGALGGTWWYECVRTVGWALFAYLPIFVGYNAAREFGGSPILGGIAGALCVANTAMPLLAEYDGTQIALPLTGAVYNPSNGGLMAALIAGALLALLERQLHRVMPSIIDTFATPLVVLVVGSVAIVGVLQPVGAALTQGIYVAMRFLYETMGALGGYLLAATFLPLVSVGLHQALTPIHAMLNDPAGPTGGINYLLPILMVSGGGQVGAGLALYLRSRNARLRRYVRDAIPVGVLGVGEPLMYAVILPLGRPFVTACLGAGVGGALASGLHVGAASQGVSGVFGLLIVEPNSQVAYLVSLAVACAAGFVLTWFFGVDDKRIDDTYGAS